MNQYKLVQMELAAVLILEAAAALMIERYRRDLLMGVVVLILALVMTYSMEVKKRTRTSLPPLPGQFHYDEPEELPKMTIRTSSNIFGKTTYEEKTVEDGRIILAAAAGMTILFALVSIVLLIFVPHMGIVFGTISLAVFSLLWMELPVDKLLAQAKR